MAENALATVCRRINIDADGLVTIEGIAEGIAFPTVDESAIGQNLLLRDAFIATIWTRSNPTVPEKTKIRFSLIDPSGNSHLVPGLSADGAELDLTSQARMRAFMRFPAIPFHGSGHYRLAVEEKIGDSWKSKAFVPLEVSVGAVAPLNEDASKIKEEADRLCEEIEGRLVRHLWMRWELFKELFHEGEARLELLNAGGTGNVFYQLFHLMLNDISLAFTRLAGPAWDDRGRERLSLRLLVNKTARFDPALFARLKARLEEVETATLSFRTRADAQDVHEVGHLEAADYGFKKADVDSALRGVIALLDAYRGVTTHYSVSRGARPLLEALVMANEYRRLLDEGKVPPDDWKKSRYLTGPS